MYPNNKEISLRLSILNHQQETLIAQRDEIDKLIKNIDSEKRILFQLKELNGDGINFK